MFSTLFGIYAGRAAAPGKHWVNVGMEVIRRRRDEQSVLVQRLLERGEDDCLEYAAYRDRFESA